VAFSQHKIKRREKDIMRKSHWRGLALLRCRAVSKPRDSRDAETPHALEQLFLISNFYI
jgi:hypothetical protein